jgi:large subunit ribosomal protein L32e
MINTKMLEVRKSIKKRKPNFHIQNSNDPAKRFVNRWKRPKGLQNKMRENRKGNPISVEPGYGSPEAVKGTSPEGFRPIMINNISDLSKVTDGCAGVVSAYVGMKNKTEIVKAAITKKIKLLNVKTEDFSQAVEKSMAARKKKRQDLLSKRKSRAEPKKADKTAAKEASKETIETKTETDEEKKKAEKEEKDKVLTKAK